MSEQNQNLVVCKNGHQQNVSNSRFCVYCGIALAQPTAPPPNQQFNQPTTPPIQPVNGQPFGQSQQPQQPQQPQFGQPFQQNWGDNFQPPNNQFQPFQQPPINQIQPFQPQPFNAPGLNQNFHQPGPFQPGQQFVQPQQVPLIQYLDCYSCGGNGQKLAPKIIVCQECNWLRPLVPGYQVNSTAFEWAADAKAMSALRSVKTLTSIAETISNKIGRRWIEATFNGVLLSEKQVPQVYEQAVKAARILGMSHMPDVYISGERSWDCVTYGTTKDSFVVIGSALASNFQGDDLLFLLAREMGHCRAGHSLWKTVIRFMVGEQGSQGKGIMAEGFLEKILKPSSIIEDAIEMPLLAWSRQAEITADRAGMLAVGDLEIIRRVLLTWTLKSSMVFRQINIEAWLEQQEADGDEFSKLSELSANTTPNLIPRLRLFTQFSKDNELNNWRKMISNALLQAEPKIEPKVEPKPPTAAQNVIKLKCTNCQTPMQVPIKAFADKTELPVKCPNTKCGKITRLKKQVKKLENSATINNKKQEEENMTNGD
jgi:Zn-dependent protease with chaperone function